MPEYRNVVEHLACPRGLLAYLGELNLGPLRGLVLNAVRYATFPTFAQQSCAWHVTAVCPIDSTDLGDRHGVSCHMDRISCIALGLRVDRCRKRNAIEPLVRGDHEDTTTLQHDHGFPDPFGVGEAGPPPIIAIDGLQLGDQRRVEPCTSPRAKGLNFRCGAALAPIRFSRL